MAKGGEAFLPVFCRLTEGSDFRSEPRENAKKLAIHAPEPERNGKGGGNRRSPTLPCARSEGRQDVPRPTADKGRRNIQPSDAELATPAEPFSQNQAACSCRAKRCSPRVRFNGVDPPSPWAVATLRKRGSDPPPESAGSLRRVVATRSASPALEIGFSFGAGLL